MKKRLFRPAGQTGSVSPVAIALTGIVLLLLMIFLDREWVNYKLHLAYQMADFAAEAASRTGEAWATVDVRQYTVVRWMAPNCPQPTCLPQPQSRVEFRTQQVTAQQAELERNWRQLAGCGFDPEHGNYACLEVRTVRQEVRYPAFTEVLAREAFEANWRNHSSAVVDDLFVAAVGGEHDRRVTVGARLRVTSLTGLFSWWEPKEIVASAITQVTPLQLTN